MKILAIFSLIFIASCGTMKTDIEEHLKLKQLRKEVTSCIQEKQAKFEQKMGRI